MTRNCWHGVPDYIEQVEVEHFEDQLKVCVTLKADVLEGGMGCPNLFVS